MSDYIPAKTAVPVPSKSALKFAEGKRSALGLRLGTPLVLPKGYGYVIMTGLLSVTLLSWKSSKVSFARKELQVPNPVTHSTECKAFNCVFRALQSTVEIYPQFLFLLLTGGLEMPYFCSAAGLIWICGRFVYARGYYSGDPRKRANGSFFLIGHLMLLFATLKFGLKRLFT